MKFPEWNSEKAFIHKVYLGGSMNSLPATPHCCDCANSGGHLLFDLIIPLGDCDE